MRNFSTYKKIQESSSEDVKKNIDKKNRQIIDNDVDRLKMDIKGIDTMEKKPKKEEKSNITENIKNINGILYFENCNTSNVVNYINNNNNKIKYYIINNKSINELHVINNNGIIDVKFFIENLILYYNKNSMITENISTMNVIGNKNFTILKNIPILLQNMFVKDLINLLTK